MNPIRRGGRKQAAAVETPRVQTNGKAHGKPTGGGNGEDTGKALSVRFAKMRTSHVAYMWDRRLAIGEVTLLTGGSTAGKSTLLCAVIADLTTGKPLPGGPQVEPVNVAMLIGEDNPSTVVAHRLKACGYDPKRCHALGYDEEGRRTKLFQLPDDLGAIQGELKRLKAKAFFVDPINDFDAPSQKEDEGKRVRRLLQSLADMSREVGCCTLVVRNPRKGTVGDPLDMVSGTKEWVNTPRFIMYYAVHPRNPALRVLASLKASPARTLPDAFDVGYECMKEWGRSVFGQSNSLKASDLYEEKPDKVESSCREQAKHWLRVMLDEGEQRSKDMQALAEDAGHKWMTVRRAAEELGIVSAFIRRSQESFHVWRKPADGWPD